MVLKSFKYLVLMIGLFFFSSCSTPFPSSGDFDNYVACRKNNGNYSVNVTTTGVVGTLLLQNNSSDNLSITSDGNSSFSKYLCEQDNYLVTVTSQPNNQTCSISNPTGVITQNNISNISISCKTPYEISGNLSGLDTLPVTLNLQSTSQGGGINESLILSTNGAFKFNNKLDPNANYSITMPSHPNGQFCVLGGATSAINILTNVTSLSLVCENFKYIYITNSTYTGNLGTTDTIALTNADIFCNSDSAKPSDAKNFNSFKALLAVNNLREPGQTDWVLQDGVKYRRSGDKAVIFTAGADGNFLFGSLSNSIDQSAGKTYWTGIDNSIIDLSSIGTNDCGGWTTSTFVDGASGTSGATDTTSFAVSSPPKCDTLQSLLCVEQ